MNMVYEVYIVYELYEVHEVYPVYDVYMVYEVYMVYKVYLVYKVNTVYLHGMRCTQCMRYDMLKELYTWCMRCTCGVQGVDGL